ncbi:MAG: hypothetical protein KJ621_15745 [Proteobacteria bacterium]|nr:hypothetical protein [Pseudomonadota bacterium]
MSRTDIVREIRRATRRKLSAEEKVRIVLEGLEERSPSASIGHKNPWV